MRLLVLICSSLVAAQGIDLYPFGLANGDRQHPTIDDACRDHYNFPITMFGKEFTTVYVCTNGILSLGKEFPQYTPEPFPLKSRTSIIAPYWADGDPGVGGRVWSRITSDPALLQQATTSIRRGFLSAFNDKYNASTLLIATWDDIKPFGGTSSDLGNTFQVVVASDGITVYAIFNHKTINWTYGTASGDISAQVGFDSGDMVNHFTLPNSRSPSIRNIPRHSNVGVPGRHIFRIGEVKDSSNKIVVTERNGNVVRPTLPSVSTTRNIGILQPDRIGMTTTLTTSTTGATKSVMSDDVASLIKRILELRKEQKNLLLNQNRLLSACNLKTTSRKKDGLTEE